MEEGKGTIVFNRRDTEDAIERLGMKGCNIVKTSGVRPELFFDQAGEKMLDDDDTTSAVMYLGQFFHCYVFSF